DTTVSNKLARIVILIDFERKSVSNKKPIQDIRFLQTVELWGPGTLTEDCEAQSEFTPEACGRSIDLIFTGWSIKSLDLSRLGSPKVNVQPSHEFSVGITLHRDTPN